MAAEHFRTFHLPGLLAPGHTLILNPLGYILTQLAPNPCRIVAQEKLTEQQMYVLVALLESYPEYAPLEALEVALTDETIEQVMTKINRAIDEHTLDTTTRTLRNVLLRLKPKLKSFGLGVASVHKFGYQLVTLR
jgi:hypothetical protein